MVSFPKHLYKEIQIGMGMKSKIIFGLIIVMLVLAVGCSKETPAPETTKEPVPAVPIVEEEVTDVEPVIEEPAEDTSDVTEEPEEVADEGVTDVEETEDELTADNFRVVSLKDLNAYPTEMEINVGTTVEWRNINDNFNHIIGWKNQKGMGVVPEPILPGESWSYTFTEPMVIKWFSTAKPTIQGTITVVEPKE